MNENIRLAIEKLQEANTAAVVAQFNLREVTQAFEEATDTENAALALVRQRELELTKAVRENVR